MKEYHKVKLDPKCLNNKQGAFAMTNRGELIPCCWLDTDQQREEIEYKELLLASRIDDYDSIEEIYLTDEWIQFYENLKNGIGFLKCHEICKWRETDSHKMESTIDVNTGKVKKVKST